MYVLNPSAYNVSICKWSPAEKGVKIVGDSNSTYARVFLDSIVLFWGRRRIGGCWKRQLFWVYGRFGFVGFVCCCFLLTFCPYQNRQRYRMFHIKRIAQFRYAVRQIVEREAATSFKEISMIITCWIIPGGSKTMVQTVKAHDVTRNGKCVQSCNIIMCQRIRLNLFFFQHVPLIVLLSS